jgi:RNA polymerase sigma-70 factor (ECF subfamily)
MMTDKEIIALYSSGRHEQAFNQIVENYTERIYWHVRRFVCSHEDSNDLLQDIFIKIWAALPSFRGDAQLFTWIYRIATNEVLNHLRKEKFKALISFDSESSALERKIDEDPHFNGDAIQRELHKAIQRLPQKQRVVFNLRYFEEMKYEDISEITGTSVGALKASYHHAYGKIKDELKKISYN